MMGLYGGYAQYVYLEPGVRAYKIPCTAPRPFRASAGQIRGFPYSRALPARQNVHEICSRNLRIVGMNNHTHTKYKAVMEMMLRHKDTFPWERLFSHRFPLAEQAVKASMTRESMKVVIDPWME